MSSFSDTLLERMAPYLTPDHITYLETLASMFDEVDLYVGFDSEENGWSVILDVATCPPAALGYLGQFVGERLPVGLSEVMQREWIDDHPNLSRGTLYSIFRAAQRSLINDRLVSVIERSGGGANPEDYLEVTTYTGDTPDTAVVLADLLQVVPADIDLTYQMLAGQTWSAVASGYASWTAVDAHYASWDEVATDRAGVNTFSRPRPE